MCVGLDVHKKMIDVAAAARDAGTNHLEPAE